MKGFPQVIPLASEADIKATLAAAAAENHFLHLPTHAFKRDGEIVGAVSLGGCVTALCWFGAALRSRETASLFNAMENTLRFQKVRHLIVPCSESSPFYTHMGAIGFEALTPATLFAKTL